ncbi:MAG: BrnT family toxin [Dolichospermum sp.]|jgi:uncharacterized DUF497 family protein
MEFEWDTQKAKSNLSKHNVSFEEAQTVFDDQLYVDFYDPDHSEDELGFCWFLIQKERIKLELLVQDL